MPEMPIVNLEDAIDASYWRIVLADIKNGNGVATVTLKSGVQLVGRVDRNGPSEPGISLKSGELKYTGSVHKEFVSDGGWHVIDFTQVAAITGSLSS